MRAFDPRLAQAAESERGAWLCPAPAGEAVLHPSQTFARQSGATWSAQGKRKLRSHTPTYSDSVILGRGPTKSAISTATLDLYASGLWPALLETGAEASRLVVFSGRKPRGSGLYGFCPTNRSRAPTCDSKSVVSHFWGGRTGPPDVYTSDSHNTPLYHAFLIA